MNRINEEITRLEESINDVICYIPFIDYCEERLETAINVEDIKFWGLCYALRIARYNISSNSKKEYLVHLNLLYLIAKEISNSNIFTNLKNSLDTKEVELNNEIQNSSTSKRRNKKEGDSRI